MKDVIFQSDTFNKLLKIQNGKVFASETTFITEFIQNCQRSKSHRIDFTITGNENCDTWVLTCEDDGCGCKNAQYLFTLDYSNWDSTSEGFGIGFWSCLAVPELSKILIDSKNWEIKVNTKELFQLKNNAITTLVFDEIILDGFKVSLYSNWIKNNSDYLKEEIAKVGKNIDIPIYINGERIYQIDIISQYEEDCNLKGIPCYRYSNSLYDAIFSPGSYGDNPRLYYENREVKNLYDLSYVGGIIHAKTGKVDLVEPDRTRYVYNDKWYKMSAYLRKDIASMYKDYLKEFGLDNQDYCNGIAEFLEPRDYKKYLSISFLDDEYTIGDDDEFFNVIDKEEDDEDISSNKIAAETVSIPINRSDYREQNQEIVTSSHRKNFYDTPVIEKKDFITKKTLISKSVWVKSSELEDYKNEVAKARYCGIPVIVVDNILQEKALKDANVVNVSYLDDVLKETITKKDICIKNANEEAFIRFLQPICDRFNLPYDTFRIANLETIREFYDANGHVTVKSGKNNRNKLITYGLCEKPYIYLDRKALALNKLKMTHCSKATRYKALLQTSRTIAHELAHYLFDTVDNTILHYKREQQIWMEILNLYN